MPIRTETIDLDAEVERLEEEKRDLASQVAALEEGNPKRDELLQRGMELDAHLDGLDAVRDPPADVAIEAFDEVTLGGLTGGEYGRVQDNLAGAAQVSSESPGTGAWRVYMVAQGTQSAPYVDGAEDFDAAVAATAALPLGYLKWAQSRIDDLTSVSGNERTSFGDLVRETSATEGSPESSSTTTQSPSQ